MNTRLTIRRPGRAVAVVGAVVAVSATTMMALIAGTASAAPTTGTQPGRCVQAVNVRSEPDIDSRIVAVCEAGKQVQVAETKNGFVHLSDLSGWAAQEYVSVNGSAPAAPADRAPSGGAGDRVVPSQAPEAARHHGPPNGPADPADGDAATDPAADPSVDSTTEPDPAPSPLDSTPLGGLLGG